MKMTKGAMATVAVKAYPEAVSIKRAGSTVAVHHHFPTVTKQKLANARAVLAYAPEQADEIGGRGKKGSATEHFPMVTQQKLSMARAV